MKKHLLYFFLLLVCCGCVEEGYEETQTISKIYGTVIDYYTGNTVSNATVMLYYCPAYYEIYGLGTSATLKASAAKCILLLRLL